MAALLLAVAALALLLQTSAALEQSETVRAVLSSDGRSAVVRFRHSGRDHHYRLGAYSVFAEGAELVARTERGKERLEIPALGLFRTEDHGRRATARLHADGSVSGLFEHEGRVISVEPVRTRGFLADPEAINGSAAAPKHRLRNLPRLDLIGRGKGLAGARRLSSEPAVVSITSDSLEELEEVKNPEIDVDAKKDFMEVSDLPSDEMPRSDSKIAAMEHWGGMRWYGGGSCYAGDSDLHEFLVSIVVDAEGWKKHGDGVVTHIQDTVAQSSFIYEMQLHMRVKIGNMQIWKTESGAPAYATGCPTSKDLMGTKLDQLKDSWGSLTYGGAIHLFTGCGTDFGTVGLAYVGTMCSLTFNIGVDQINDDSTLSTFLIFAHEMGHNFGARHTFDDGQGKTGGLMDYGDGHLDGVYQFHTKYLKKDMCDLLNRRVGKCSGRFQKASDSGPAPVPSPPASGAGSNCTTVGGVGVGRGKTCVFPFIFKDIKYHSCTTDGHSTIWCATEVDDKGILVEGKWAECSWSPQCIGADSPCKTVGESGAGAGHNCIFPFKYAAQKFETCTLVRPLPTRGMWCATKVDTDGNMQEWGNCDRTDYCVNQWKTVGWAGIPQEKAYEWGNQAYSKLGEIKKSAAEMAGNLNPFQKIGAFFSNIWSRSLALFGAGKASEASNALPDARVGSSKLLGLSGAPPGLMANPFPEWGWAAAAVVGAGLLLATAPAVHRASRLSAHPRMSGNDLGPPGQFGQDEQLQLLG